VDQNRSPTTSDSSGRAAPWLESLAELIGQSFVRSGGDMQAGRKLLDLVRDFDIEGNVGAEVLALPGTSLPAAAPPVRHRLGRAAALHGYGRRAGAASKGRRSRARRAGSLGHHLHAPAVLGPARGVARSTASHASAQSRYAAPPIRSTASSGSSGERSQRPRVSKRRTGVAARDRSPPLTTHSARSWTITDGSRSRGVKLGAAASSRKRPSLDVSSSCATAMGRKLC
jgi:hypothetical protein